VANTTFIKALSDGGGKAVVVVPTLTQDVTTQTPLASGTLANAQGPGQPIGSTLYLYNACGGF